MKGPVTWIVDTTVMCEYLDIPGFASDSQSFVDELELRHEAGDRLIVPLVVMVEVGNHIGQISDGQQRRQRAEAFSEHMRRTLDDDPPYRVHPFPTPEDLQAWLAGTGPPDYVPSFPEWAAQKDRKAKGCGLGDLAILYTGIALSRRRLSVRVWTKDEELERRFRAYVG